MAAVAAETKLPITAARHLIYDRSRTIRPPCVLFRGSFADSYSRWQFSSANRNKKICAAERANQNIVARNQKQSVEQTRLR